MKRSFNIAVIIFVLGFTLPIGAMEPEQKRFLPFCAIGASEAGSIWYPKYLLEQGLMCCSRDGVDADYEKAIDCFEQAAKQEVDKSAQALANLYLGYVFQARAFCECPSCSFDFDCKALEYYHQAAEQTENKAAQAEAYVKLGQIYRSGEGVAIDYHRAMECFFRATAHDESNVVRAIAYNNIGAMLYEGRGTPANTTRARSYFQQVIEQTENIEEQMKARLMLGLTYSNPNPGDGAAEYDKAIVQFQYVADFGGVVNSVQAIASFMLGQLFFLGHGCDVDYDRAKKYIEEALRQKIGQRMKERAQFLLDQIEANIHCH